MATAVTDGHLDALDYSPLRTLSNLWAITWQHKALVLLGVTVGLILGGLAYVQTTPVYQSGAQMVVIKRHPNDVIPTTIDQRESYYDDYLSTHVVLIQSDKVLKLAAKKIDPTILEIPPAKGDVAALLKAGLTVARDKESSPNSYSMSNILNLSFRCSSSADCPLLISSVIQGYQQFLVDTYGSMNKETVYLIEKMKRFFDGELKQKQADYMKLCEQNPLVLKTKDGLLPFQDRINRIESRLSAINLRQKEIETRQKLIETSLKEKKSRSVIMAMLKETANGSKSVGPGLAQPFEASLVELQLKLEEMSSVLGPAHPQVKDLQKRIDRHREQLARYGKADQTSSDIDPLDLHRESLKLEYEENKLLRQKLEPELEVQQKEAQDMAKYLLTAEESQNEMNRIRQAFDAISGRLQQITLTRDAGGYDADVITPAAAGTKVAPSLFSHLALALLGGLALGVGLAYLADYSDKSFRSPQEIQQRLGQSVIGHIPYIAEDAKGDPAAFERAAPALVAVHAPRSPEAESFRGVRTALYFSTQGRGHQVVQVTSPGMGDGKSTLTANLAVSIAQSGKRTVLIDADFRRPRVHKLFPDLQRDTGLASVMAGEATLEQALQKTVVPNLSVLPCGPRPSNPAELLTSLRFQELLADVRSQFDFVLIDTPPVLLVSDPCAVAPRVDGVLLVLRLKKNNRPTAERACEVLASLGAKVLGVMVNDSEQSSGGGSYGYGYGYGYNYRYRYDYRYSYQYGYGYQPAYAETDDDGDDDQPHGRTTRSNGYHPHDDAPKAS
jgi:capsular exopolysaccharide synthesis family protein